MTMIDMAPAQTRLPVWLWVMAAFGVAWNVFGLVQLADFIGQTRASLMMKGMSPTAADLYYALPVWMKAAFAIGSTGGLIGSLALAARRRWAVPVFGVSLAGYVALYAGDYGYGVFEVIPGQMAVLSLVVAIALGLAAVSLWALRRGLLR